MKLPEPIPVPVKDLIWHLPDLLEGTDPVLARPAVRDYVTSDPEARGAVLAVAHVARSLTGASDWMQTLPRQAAAELTRPVEKAARYFKKELVDLLFDVGLSHFDAVTKGRGLVFETQFLKRRKRKLDEKTGFQVRLAESLGLGGAVLPIQTSGTELMAAGREPSLVNLDVLMNACETILPGLNGVGFYLIIMRTLRGERVSPSEWVEYARSTPTGQLSSFGLQQAGHLLMTGSRFDEAMTMYRHAEWELPDDVFCRYYSARACARTGDYGASSHWLLSWSEQLEDSAYSSAIASSLIECDRAVWKQVYLGESKVFEGGLARLPQYLRNIFLEAML